MLRGTVPHALLFTGTAGIGKRTTAHQFTMACNCKSQNRASGDGNKLQPEDLKALACGQCRSCRKIEAGSHPDVLTVRPSGQLIRIDQIRELGHALSMKPFEAKHRVVIIADAQRMNPSAGNALLKMLEEPPDRTILILVATRRSDLLPTIVSRCQHLRFNPIPQAALTDLLIQKKGIDRKTAESLAMLAGGSFTRAVDLMKKGWINRRKWLIRALESLPDQSAVLQLALVSEILKDKDLLSDSLEIMETWFRDVTVAQFDPKKLINGDLTERILSASQQISAKTALDKLQAIHVAQRRLRSNANSRLTMEALIMKLARVS